MREAAYGDYRKFIAARRPAQNVPDEEALHQQWLARHPLGFLEQRDAYAPNGVYGRWLRTHDAVAQVGDVLFMHAGLDPELRVRSVEDLNKKIRSEIADFDKLWQVLTQKKVIWRYMTLEEALNQAKLAFEAQSGSIGSMGYPGDIEGMRQMLAIIQAFMCAPELVILDEPTSGLDPLGQRSFNEFLLDQAENGSLSN